MRKKNSILFVRPDYHCSFFYRDEFRKRGWKADIWVNNAYPEELLYSDQDILRAPAIRGDRFRVIRWINYAIVLLWYMAIFSRYRIHVFYGPPPVFSRFEQKLGFTRLFGKDFLLTAWLARIAGCKLVYLPTGCRDEDSKVGWQQIDNGNVCNNCGFFDRCDDRINLLNFFRVRRYFEFGIGFGLRDSKQYNEKHIKYKSIDLNYWSSRLTIPPEHQLPPTTKLRILHSDYLTKSGRNWEGRNIKGTPYVVAAIDRLREEGYPVEYMYIESKPSNQMRFYQAQADIVVDQLIYGWWGSTGVETMALGKPVVCFLRPSWKVFFLKTYSEYSSLPIVEADTSTIYDVLKKLVIDEDYRKRKGEESRRFAEAHFDPEKNTRAFAQILEGL